MNVLIRQSRVWQSGPEPGYTEPVDVLVKDERIFKIAKRLPGGSVKTIDADGLILFPGLINAHDHLEMNLYPRLATRWYADMYEWSEDVFKPREPPIRDIERLPVSLRLLWGGYKNLLSGVTTVAHHNPWHRSLGSRKFPVKVLSRYRWSHSPGLSKDVERDFRRGSRSSLFFIHAAEGTSTRAGDEIGGLEEKGVLGPNTVLVHAISADTGDIERMSRSRCRMVWCPSSNRFLYGRTAPVARMLGKLRCALGTDATISGSATMWDELREANATSMLSSNQIVNLVTTDGAETLDLRDGRGSIREGAPADLLLLPFRGRGAADLIDASARDLELVLSSGALRLAGERIARELGLRNGRWPVAGREIWLSADFGKLVEAIAAKVPADILAQNSLWSMLVGPGSSTPRAL